MAHRLRKNRPVTAAIALCLALYQVTWGALFLPACAESLTGGGSDVPAGQTELSQQGRSLKVNVFGPVKGLQSNVADLARDGDYAKVLDNLHMLKRGVWSSRGTGCTKQRANVFNSGGRFFQIVPTVDDNGAQRLVLHVGDALYTYDFTTETSKKTGLSTSAQSDIKNLDDDYVIFTNGAEATPLRWDGNPANNFVALSPAWPVTNISPYSFTTPKYNEAYRGRLVTAGFTAYPGTVLISKFGNPSSYPVPSGLTTDAGAIGFPSSLGPIVGLKTYRLDNTSNDQVLLVGCERGFAMVTGSDASDFEGVTLTGEFGLLSNRSWLQIGQDLYFFATDGIRKFSSSLGSSSLSVSPVTFGNQDILNRLNLAAKEKIFVVHHPSSQEAAWFFPIDANTESSNALVMNYTMDEARSITQVQNPIFSTMSGVTFTCASTYGNVSYVGTTNGYLKILWSGDDFDGTPIAWTYVTPLIGANSPAQASTALRFIILTEGGRQKFDAQAYTLTTMATGQTEWKTQDAKSFDQTGATVTKIGTWPSGTWDEYPKLIDFYSKGSGRFWALKLSGDATGEHIDLEAIQAILNLGGWRD